MTAPYVLRMEDGTLVEVSREVYLEWHQSRRRERYQNEKDRKYGVYSLDEKGQEKQGRKAQAKKKGEPEFQFALYQLKNILENRQIRRRGALVSIDTSDFHIEGKEREPVRF